MENDLKIANVKPFKTDLKVKIKTMIQNCSDRKYINDVNDNEFKETLLIDEVLEAEDE